MTSRLEKKVVASQSGDRITIEYMWDHDGVEHWGVVETVPTKTMIRLPDDSWVAKDDEGCAPYREV